MQTEQYEVNWKNYYKTLRLSPTASAQEIKRAYRRLARKYHPDWVGDSIASNRMAEINEAYEVLSQTDRRAKYDERFRFTYGQQLTVDEALEAELKEVITRLAREQRRDRYTERPPVPSGRPRMRKAPLIFLSLALLGAIVCGVVVTQQRNALNNELESVKSFVSTTNQTLLITRAEIGSTNQIVASVRPASTQDMLLRTQQRLRDAEETLGGLGISPYTSEQYSGVQPASTEVQATLLRTQQQLAVAEETLRGLGITLSGGEHFSGIDLIDNPTATNPTWSQLMAFLAQDQTETFPYIANVYDCTHFAEDVHNNAEAVGIKAAWVGIDFVEGGDGHALNAFLTTDYGLVYVDCVSASDKIARVKKGKEYLVIRSSNITGANVRDDYWWDAQNAQNLALYLSSDTGGHSVTEYISIYW